MSAADFFPDQMALITGNLGGAIQSLPKVSKVGGKERTFSTIITLAAQASGSKFAVARIPLPFVYLGINVYSSVSLSTATLAFGNLNAPTAYGAAGTVTATNVPNAYGPAGSIGSEITAGWDSTTGNPVNYSSSSGFGGAYDDVVMITGVAALPASGTLVVITKYAID